MPNDGCTKPQGRAPNFSGCFRPVHSYWRSIALGAAFWVSIMVPMVHSIDPNNVTTFDELEQIFVYSKGCIFDGLAGHTCRISLNNNIEFKSQIMIGAYNKVYIDGRGHTLSGIYTSFIGVSGCDNRCELHLFNVTLIGGKVAFGMHQTGGAIDMIGMSGVSGSGFPFLNATWARQQQSSAE